MQAPSLGTDALISFFFLAKILFTFRIRPPTRALTGMNQRNLTWIHRVATPRHMSHSEGIFPVYLGVPSPWPCLHAAWLIFITVWSH